MICLFQFESAEVALCASRLKDVVYLTDKVEIQLLDSNPSDGLSITSVPAIQMSSIQVICPWQLQLQNITAIFYMLSLCNEFSWCYHRILKKIILF